MDGDLQKRNTDCVYFLASPLTCKKGADCEYRHSDMARLNPRDCWYWISGNCLNPNCAFRHPPLEGHTEPSTESATTRPTSHKCSAPINKIKTPCYFYFNGYCTKGDCCSFLHGPDVNDPSFKPPRPSVTPVPPPPAAIINKPPTPTSSLPCNGHEKPIDTKPVLQPVDIKVADAAGRPADEDFSAVRSEGFQNGSTLVNVDRADDHVETEWRESSPGFDVLVDNHMDSEDDDEDDRDTDYIELERPSDQIRYEPVVSSYGEDVYMHKRRLSPVLPDGPTTVDLRNHLRKRRLLNNHHEVSQLGNGFSHPKPRESGSRFLSSEISRRAPVRERISVPEPALFTGPKTLDQIKEEKHWAAEDDGLTRMDPGRGYVAVDFAGPKRLCEILEEKKRVFLEGKSMD